MIAPLGQFVTARCLKVGKRRSPRCFLRARAVEDRTQQIAGPGISQGAGLLEEAPGLVRLGQATTSRHGEETGVEAAKVRALFASAAKVATGDGLVDTTKGAFAEKEGIAVTSSAAAQITRDLEEPSGHSQVALSKPLAAPLALGFVQGAPALPQAPLGVLFAAGFPVQTTRELQPLSTMPHLSQAKTNSPGTELARAHPHFDRLLWSSGLLEQVLLVPVSQDHTRL